MGDLFDAGRDQSAQARKTLQSVRLPGADELRVQLQHLVQQGQITPLEAQTIEQQGTAYHQIEEDPRLRGSQIDALSELEGIVDQGGLDAQARAGLYEIGQQQATENRGSREAILANAQARGLGNSDLALVQQMIADQGAATRGAAQGVNVAALAEQRRDAARAQQAQLAASIGGQDYQRKSDEAAAADAINRFNAANRQDVVNRNVQNANIAQATNLGERQRVADTNVGLHNQQELQNKQVPLTLANLQLQKAGGVAGAYGREAQADAEHDRELLGLFSDVGQSIFQAKAHSDERIKEDVRGFDSAKVLEDLSGVKYRHKNPERHGEGERYGLVAQDVERVQPSAVTEDADGTKVIDFGQLTNFLSANLIDMNDRLKRVEGRR